MVPQGGRTHILQPSGIPLQPVASGIISATSMERGLHQTNSKSTSATTASRLPTYLDHIITDQNDGACRCPLLPIPGFSKTSPSLSFSDQYAFRPSGSTTAAIVSLLQTVTSLLQSNPFVVVISLDFSKAFDTVRHSGLLTKMAELDLPAVVYNWLVAFFAGHAHRTVYNDEVSSRGRYQPALFKVTVSDQRRTPSQPPTLNRSTPTTASSSSQTTLISSSRLSAPTRAPQNSTTLQRGRPRTTCS